jgi:hypothetical protein
MGMVGPDAADRVLRNIHHQIFREWLSLNLSEQKADLDEYLGQAKRLVHQISYREFIPALADEIERQLYLTDLEILVLQSFEQAGASPLPKASPRR